MIVSREATRIAGLFVEAFLALGEHGKVSAAEQQALAEVVACHLRSGFPMALRATGDEASEEVAP